MDATSIRYIVDDIDSAIDFYTRHLDFEERMRPGPGFAMLQRGSLRLLLNTPAGGGGAGQPMSDGRLPEPGGWNRFQIEIGDLDATVGELRQAGADFRGEITAAITAQTRTVTWPCSALSSARVAWCWLLLAWADGRSACR